MAGPGSSRGRSGGRAGGAGYNYQDHYIAWQLARMLRGDQDPIIEVLWEKKAMDSGEGGRVGPVHVDDVIIRLKSGRCIYTEVKQAPPDGPWSARNLVQRGVVGKFWEQWRATHIDDRSKIALRLASGGEVRLLALINDAALRARTPYELLSVESSTEVVEAIEFLASNLALSVQDPELHAFLKAVHGESLPEKDELSQRIVDALGVYGSGASRLAKILVGIVAKSKHPGPGARSSHTRESLIEQLEEEGIEPEVYQVSNPPEVGHQKPLVFLSAVTGASAVLIVIVTFLLLYYWKRPESVQRWNLAVLPFEVVPENTGSAQEGRQLARLLREKLSAVEASPQLGLVDPEATPIEGTFRTPVSLDFTLRGSLHSQPKLLVEAELYDHGKTSVEALRIGADEGHTEGGLLDLAQGLAVSLLGELEKRGLKVPPDTFDRLAVMPTSSSQALELNNRGLELLLQGDLEAADQSFTEALHLDPNFASVHANRAWLAEVMGRPEAAREGYEKAAELLPGFAPFQYQLGRFYLYSSVVPEGQEPQTYAQALSPLQEAVRLDPSFTDAYHELGNAYLLQEEPDEARRVLQRARLLAPRDPGILKSFGWATLVEGDSEEAIDSFQTARSLLPEIEMEQRSEITYWLAAAREQAGDRTEACLQLGEARQLDPQRIVPLPPYLQKRVTDLAVDCGRMP